MEQSDSISLNKYISSTGICSRREADQWIDAGRIKLNGQVARKGNRVFQGDVVLLDNKPLKSKPKQVYLAFNKPVGIVCTTDTKEKNNIVDFINYPERLFHVGRLDKPSEGLIFMTNDGDIVNKILRAGNQHEKEYIVQVDRPVTADFIRKMRAGVPILNTVTKPCFCEKIGKKQFRIILTQGLNRQIRRMCAYLNYEVTSLKRIRIMHIDLEGIAVGKYRHFTKEEMKTMNRMIRHSSKT